MKQSGQLNSAAVCSSTCGTQLHYLSTNQKNVNCIRHIIVMSSEVVDDILYLDSDSLSMDGGKCLPLGNLHK